MLFHGQNVVELSGANYSANAWRPGTAVPYENYTDEAIYFTSDSAITNSFRTKFDDHWVNVVDWADYANITQPLVRHYDIFPKDPSLNFPPAENYRTRSVNALQGRDAGRSTSSCIRITDRQHTDNILAAVARGIPVRLFTEQEQYRLASRMWHSWNVDRLYMGGVQIKHRAHAGMNHQKSVILYDQNGTVEGDQSMVIFGSSNWTSPSASGQVEHNVFSTQARHRLVVRDSVRAQVEQHRGHAGDQRLRAAARPTRRRIRCRPSAPPDVGDDRDLKWYGGPWAHLYDLYIDTSSTFTTPAAILYADLAETPAKTEKSTFSYTVPIALAPGTTYYWKVVGKTMALKTKSSAVWSFTTGGAAHATATAAATGRGGEIVLYASAASLRVGAWQVEPDATAAGGAKIRNPNAGAAKITTASATPANYFELTFNAEAGRGYRLWVRGRADSNNWANDSVFVQFNNSVTSAGAETWRIGSSSATEVNLEDCSGCGIAGWGWQDNGWGVNVMGPLVYFASTGPQTLRVQTREDGFAIDQIVLSPVTFVNSSPGALKNDTRILP